MGDKKLSFQEQQAYDRLLKRCSRPLASIPPALQNTCLVVKKQVETEAAQRKAEAESIARAQILGARLEATMFVVDRMTARQAEATMLLGSLMQASNEYDQILAARAAKPFLAEALLGFALAFVPELGVLGRIASRCVPNVTSTRVIRALSKSQSSGAALPAWEALAENLLVKSQKINERVISFSQVLDRASNDAIQGVRAPLLSSSDADADTKQRLAGFNAKNRVMSDLVAAISRSLWVMSKLQHVLFQFILWSESPDVPAQVKAAFSVADLLDDVPYTANTFTIFADLILYDMLRAYVKSYVAVTQTDPYPGSGMAPPIDVDGLDGAQTRMIFARFGSGRLKWKDPTRPPIDSGKDLATYWGASYSENHPIYHAS